MSIKKTAIYIRVSSNKQAQDGDSIGAQRDALRKYIDSHDSLVFAGEYLDDGISGTKADRDELQRLLDDVRAGKIDLILITKLDRWFRSVRHYTATQEILDRYNVGWMAIWEPIYDTTTPQGRLIVNQMMSIAQFEAENTGQRIRQVQAYKVTQGEVISGTAPHGYSIVNKHLVPNEHAESVLRAFKAFSMNGSINGTLVEISGLEGLPRLQKGLKTMLSNPVYIGEYRGNKNFCLPIIPRDLWDDVQRQLPMNVKKSQHHCYIFSGLVVCDECGCAMGGNARKRMRQKGEVLTLQYRCPKHFQRRPHQCINQKVLTEPVLERYMLTELHNTIQAVDIEVKQKKPKDNRKQIAALERKVNRLKELYLNDLITLDEYKQDKESLSQKLEVLKAEKPPELAPIRAFKGVFIDDIYKSLTPQEKRRFWRGIVRKIHFNARREIVVEYL